MGKMFSRSAYFEVFDGVSLPHDEPRPKKIGQLFDINWYTVQRVIFGFSLGGGVSDAIVGKAKTPTSLDPAQAYVAKYNKIDVAPALPPVEGYKLFGGDDYVTILGLLLKTNPFFAMALTTSSAKGATFALTAHDAAWTTPPTLYAKLIGTMIGYGRRVNFVFDDKMQIIECTYYDEMSAQTPIKVTNGDDLQKWAAAGIYNLLFFVSAIHGTIHVLHFLMTSGLDVASSKFDALQTWAEIYDDNIAFKYLQVYLLLIGPEQDPPDSRIITGDAGFGASIASRDILKELLLDWSKCDSTAAFVELMFDADVYAKPQILAEFKKHVALVPGFADAAVAALKDIDAAKFDAAETHLGSYLGKCGEFGTDLKVTTVKSWLELMAITGITHGCTLSYTRLIAKPGILAWRKFLEPYWDAGDYNVMNGGLGTIVGMEPERHVMGGGMAVMAQRHFFGLGKPKFAPKLLEVLKEWDAKANDLKEKSKTEVMADPLFKDYGFLMTDFCPDNFDGKQLTIATYI